MDVRRRVAFGIAAIAIALVACSPSADAGGGGGGGGGDGSPSASPASKALVTPGGSTGPFPLSKGRYRLAARSTGCDSITVKITSVEVADADGKPLAFEESSSLTLFTKIINDVPTGTVTIEQTDASCADWEIRFDRIS